MKMIPAITESLKCSPELFISTDLVRKIRRFLASFRMNSIRVAQVTDIPALFELFSQVKSGLRAVGLDQWPDRYPAKEVVSHEVSRQEVYIMENGSQLMGSMTLNQEQAAEYEGIIWSIDTSSPYVIHRLVVAPAFWGRGLGKQWMAFAEQEVLRKGGEVIRLDTWDKNRASNRLYEGLGYQLAKGDCYFYGPAKRFVCYEKLLSRSSKK